MKKPIICAIDTPDISKAEELALALKNHVAAVKLGLEFFVANGAAGVKRIAEIGIPIFLDLKFHDIPNTVAKACSAAAELGVWMVNVHASGGNKMMEAAKDALDKCSHRPKLIAVTVLTSMDQQDLQEIGIDLTPAQQVKRLAALAQVSGMDGVVCSAQESSMLSADLGADFVLVTPGIRPAGADQGDQKRIMTPIQAMQAGSHYLVMGRPITQAADPIALLRQINQELLQA